MTRSNLLDLGKKFLVEPSGTSLTDEESRQLEILQPKSIMLRKRNFLQDVDYVTWLKAYRKLIEQIRKVLKHDHLLISLDHEGGRVIRPPEPITRFPYAARWADSVEEVGRAMSIELKSLGVNVNFAPVADVHSNPDNPVINERAFGRRPEEVSKAAVKFAATLIANGIAPCAKHFPGHGDTRTDSHFGVPVLDLTLEELRRRELVPFQALIDFGVPLVMTAHILFPKIDPENKATVSKKLLKDLLRDEMGFRGVVIADALGMAATASTLDQRETVVKAVNAGLDIFLVAGDSVTIDHALNMSKLLKEALDKGEITEAALIQSNLRIDSLINTLPQHEITELESDTFEGHHALANRLSECAPWSAFELSVPGFE